MKRTIISVLLATVTLSPSLLGQGRTPPSAEDALAKWLFPPELVLQYAQDIGLQAAQRAAIVSAAKEAQGDLFELQFQLAEQSLALQKLIASERVDEAGVLTQVDRVLGSERAMKRKQLQLLVRIKNALSKEQQDRLRELQKLLESRGAPGRPEELLRFPGVPEI